MSLWHKRGTADDSGGAPKLRTGLNSAAQITKLTRFIPY
jgi:hypothetical protein